MAEPINLPPLHVHAVSVTVQPPPNSIVGPAEMLLQQGENGGVQIDVFWRDAMGNEVHESKEMQEKEYEALRARYLHSEQATLPPFSSFKSGNTIGRVVGETAPAQVPASRANPPIEAETEEESITGEQILDSIQLGLDVVGLIPVVGEVADIASGVISLFRGDYVGAGLSLLSAIPFVGYAGTAGKAARHSTKMAEASGKAGKEVVDKAAREAAEKKAREAAAHAQEQGAKVKPKDPIHDASTPERGPDGRFIRSSAGPQKYNRDSQYPRGYRAGVKDKVLDAHTIKEGPDAGKILTSDMDVVSRNDPRITIEHKTPVVEHWNTKGYNSTKAERNDFFNDTNNMSIRLRSANSSDGGTMAAEGVRYRQDVGPNFK
ncbi:GH-E family nuclease [Pseudomonas sp. GW456-12-1-14-TSB6]|uniref:GH-E family nuclease n=1 Tax=Pseudomonas sp. GW456-12-1-14-TSB6 TaxID=2751350 RepID=UPI000CD1F5D0|nr:GH-E family nuclease [Pseudomonas sp. GW456-12-1-14-TSB6]POA28741.1 hypothetical protein C1891_28690 [Pseudomonas sp. GW456-12-1-14-TSB6]